jgi:RNA polymerase sigma factor (TIGR02999 family)
MREVTRILTAIEQGDAHASDELLPLVYQELRRLAAQRMKQEKPGQTLQATALVHEAYIRLVGSENQNWDSRGHFFAAAAEAMRRILIENARRKKRLKRGGDRQKVDLDQVIATDDNDIITDDLIALDEALEKLTVEEPVKAELIKLRYFAGLSIEQAGKMLGISRATANRYFSYARAWLFHEINK